MHVYHNNNILEYTVKKEKKKSNNDLRYFSTLITKTMLTFDQSILNILAVLVVNLVRNEQCAARFIALMKSPDTHSAAYPQCQRIWAEGGWSKLTRAPLRSEETWNHFIDKWIEEKRYFLLCGCASGSWSQFAAGTRSLLLFSWARSSNHVIDFLLGSF